MTDDIPARVRAPIAMQWSCPEHRSFVLELDGSRRCNFVGCSWVLPPQAPPEADVMERCRGLLDFTGYAPPNQTKKEWVEECVLRVAHALTEYGDQRAGEQERVNEERLECLAVEITALRNDLGTCETAAFLRGHNAGKHEATLEAGYGSFDAKVQNDITTARCEARATAFEEAAQFCDARSEQALFASKIHSSPVEQQKYKQVADDYALCATGIRTLTNTEPKP